MSKVLLVEDDNNLREIYEARLQAEGYEISSAQDGEQALVVAKQFKPDLVISDVMMPKISGFEMLDILRNTDGLEHTRVIMLTALGQAEDKTRADSLGADRYLVKSQVTLEDIVKSAHEILDADNGVATPEAQEAAPEVTPVALPTVQMVDGPSAMATEPTAAADSVPPAPLADVTPAPSEVTLSPAPQPAVPEVQPSASVIPTAPDTVQPAYGTSPASDFGATPPAVPAASAPVTDAVVSDAQPGDTTATAGSPAFSDHPGATVFSPVAAPETSTDAGLMLEPVGAPNSEPTTAEPMSSSPSTENAISDNVGTAASEQAAINKQIEDFIDSVPAEPTATPDTETPPAPEPTVPPETAPTEPVVAPNTASDDALLAEAANSFAAQSPTVISPTVTPVPTATPESAAATEPVQPETPASSTPASQTTATNDGVTIAHKKMIQPPTGSIQPDLNDLLAKEEAKDAGLQANPVAVRTDAVEDVPFPPHQPGDAFTPQSQPSQPQNGPTEQQPAPGQPAEPKKPTDFDPNSISL
jgi:two-component system phosphate regulon response regulator PhoB